MSSPTRHQRLQGHEDIHTEARCKELYVLTDEESTAQSHEDIHSPRTTFCRQVLLPPLPRRLMTETNMVTGILYMRCRLLYN